MLTLCNHCCLTQEPCWFSKVTRPHVEDTFRQPLLLLKVPRFLVCRILEDFTWPIFSRHWYKRNTSNWTNKRNPCRNIMRQVSSLWLSLLEKVARWNDRTTLFLSGKDDSRERIYPCPLTISQFLLRTRNTVVLKRYCHQIAAALYHSICWQKCTLLARATERKNLTSV